MSRQIFITGTDTEIGKTTIAVGVLSYFNKHGFSTIGIKPLASGASMTAEGLRNSDALALIEGASMPLPYALINPIVYPEPIAPHIAAKKAGEPLTVARLLSACEPALSVDADIVVIEGVGGFQVPLNMQETMADFVLALSPAVILVVGLRLGCLNHALLTYHAMLNRGIKLIGWVANCIEPNFPALNENIATLTEHIAVPLLGVVPWSGDVAGCLTAELVDQVNLLLF